MHEHKRAPGLPFAAARPLPGQQSARAVRTQFRLVRFFSSGFSSGFHLSSFCGSRNAARSASIAPCSAPAPAIELLTSAAPDQASAARRAASAAACRASSSPNATVARCSAWRMRRAPPLVSRPSAVRSTLHIRLVLRVPETGCSWLEP